MKASELLDIADVERLALRPGDVVVFKCPVRLDDAEHDWVTSLLRAVIPEPTKILILESGADIAVLGAEDAEALANGGD